MSPLRVRVGFQNLGASRSGLSGGWDFMASYMGIGFRV